MRKEVIVILRPGVRLLVHSAVSTKAGEGLVGKCRPGYWRAGHTILFQKSVSGDERSW